MESQSQNPEFRIDPENFHPCQSEIDNNNRHCIFKSLYLTAIYRTVFLNTQSICYN